MFQITGFEWDDGNQVKNLKHAVSWQESEECFFNRHFIFESKRDVVTEKRWSLLGETLKKRRLAIVFTMRGQKARVISTRPMSRRERSLYEAKKKAAQEIAPF